MEFVLSLSLFKSMLDLYLSALLAHKLLLHCLRDNFKWIFKERISHNQFLYRIYRKH